MDTTQTAPITETLTNEQMYQHQSTDYQNKTLFEIEKSLKTIAFRLGLIAFLMLAACGLALLSVIF